MTPRSEMDFDREIAIPPEWGAEFYLGAPVLACWSPLNNPWAGTVTFMGDGDCIVAIEWAHAVPVAPDIPLFTVGQKIHYIWP